MRKLLKFLLVPALASQPVITVVACNASSPGFNDDDVRNQALTAITNDSHSFQASELGLDSLPDSNTTWDKFSTTAKTKILDYYQSLLTHGSDRQFPTVNVKLEATSTAPNFINLYDNVLATFQLKVIVTYKNVSLSSPSPITIRIMNNRIADDQKLKNIEKYLKGYLTEGAHIFEMASLPVYDTNGDNTSHLTDQGIKTIETALYGTFLVQNSSNYLQIPGLSLQVINTKENQTVYAQLLLDPSSNVITGTLSKLSLQLTYRPPGSTTTISSEAFTISNVNFQQTAQQANSQISQLIATADCLFYNDDLPNKSLPSATAKNETWNIYSKDQKFTSTISSHIFNNISKVYSPLGKVIDTNMITVDNTNTTSFNIDGSDPDGNPYTGNFKNIAIHFSNKTLLTATANVTIELTMNSNPSI